MIEAGIIDPAKVARSALQNAVSAATMILTTQCLVADIPKEDENYKFYVKAANRIVNLNWVGIKRGE